jgi:hypothetical protein
LIEAEITKLQLDPQPPLSPTPSSSKKRKATSDDENDEVKAFKQRPKPAINKPMVIPPMDKTRRHAIDMAMAQLDPNASFSERVAHFDHMAEISQKREYERVCVIS